MTRRLLIALGVLAALLGVLRVRLDVDVLDLLPGEMKEVQGLRLFLEHFSKNEELILTLEHSDPNILSEHHKSLSQFLRESTPSLGTVLSEDVWSADSEEGIGEMLAWLLLNALPEDAFAQAIEKLAVDGRQAVLDDSLDTIATSLEFDQALTLAYDPYQLVQALRESHGQLIEGGDAFVSEDGTLRALYLQAPADLQNVQTWVKTVKEIAHSWRSVSPEREETSLGFTGEPVFQTEIAASMERDMKLSGITAALLTSMIFAAAYRRLRPLLALMLGLALTFLLTLGLAGWLLPNMTVMSVGFASILIGLTVDYGVLLYQNTLGQSLNAKQLRRRTCRSIGWAAVTTAAAFAALGLSVVPGMATLGQLVAIGILVGAGVMLWIYPILLGPLNPAATPSPAVSWLGNRLVARAVTGGLLLLAVLPLCLGWPNLDTSTEALRPRDSDAYATMDRFQAKLTGNDTTELAIISLTEPISQQLDTWEKSIAEHTKSARFPRALVANPEQQRANLALLEEEALDIRSLRLAAEAAGFEAEAMDLTDSILRQWQQWQSTELPRAPSSPVARRLWSRLLAHNDSGETRYLLTTLTPHPDQIEPFWTWIEQSAHGFPVSWPRITARLNERVPQDLRVVSGALGIAVLAMLGLTFRRGKPIALCIITTTLTLMSLCGAMRLLGWEWNFFSLGALLLTVGAGLDYSIHILLEHHHVRGNVEAMRQGVLRALGVCALSTVAGFASISGASNQGLASLGRVCALALTLNALVALIVLPWYLEKYPPSKS